MRATGLRRGDVWLQRGSVESGAPVVFFIQYRWDYSQAGRLTERWVTGTLRTADGDSHSALRVGRLLTDFRPASPEEAALAWRGRLPPVDLREVRPSGQPVRIHRPEDWTGPAVWPVRPTKPRYVHRLR